MKVEGDRQFDVDREVVWDVMNNPAKMAALMPGVQSFEIQDDKHWDGEGEGAARAGAAQHDRRLREDRGARRPSSRR